MGAMPVSDLAGDLLDPTPEERPGRERDNGRLLTAVMVWLYERRKEYGIEVFPCQDIRLPSGRTHVADVCVTIGMPDEQVFTQAPLLCVEIVSIFVPMWQVLSKIADYLNFGVRYVWLMDPRRRTAIVYTASEFDWPVDGILRTQNPDIALPLAELF